MRYDEKRLDYQLFIMRKFFVFFCTVLIFLLNNCGASKEEINEEIKLRSSYKTLSKDEVKSMMKKKGFFDSKLNKSGDFNNQYRARTINGDKVVIDKTTGLMWHQSGSQKKKKFEKFENALQWRHRSDSQKKKNYEKFKEVLQEKKHPVCHYCILTHCIEYMPEDEQGVAYNPLALDHLPTSTN